MMRAYNILAFLNKYGKVFIGVVFFLFISACSENTSSSKVEGEWVNEELLNQIRELRIENKKIIEKLNDIDLKVGKQNTTSLSAIKSKYLKPNIEKLNFKKEFSLGSRKAKLAIVEYTDYECPYCKRHKSRVFPKIKEQFIDSGIVMYQVQDYPLAFHPQAKKAAIAATCAGYQGKFWKMHEHIFSANATWSENNFQKTAKLLMLDSDKFLSCFNDSKQEKIVNKSIEYGNSIGVTGTPKFFIGKVDGDALTNIIVISGAQPFRVFESAINKLRKN